MIHGHGNDKYRFKGTIKADFSSNVWYENDTSGLIEHLKKNIEKIKDYPDPETAGLKKQIAGLHNLEKENILVTNGSTEAFYIIAQAFGGVSHIFVPSFAEYEDACSIYRHKIIFHDIKTILSFDPKNTQSQVWIGNPNNPDGTLLYPDRINELCRSNPETTFIIDEAYNELCPGAQSVIPLVPAFHNLMIVRSFTKAFDIPGLRLGFVVAHKNMTERLEKLKIPWSVNALAIEAGSFLCKNYLNLLPKKNIIVEKSHKLQDDIRKIPELMVLNSDCNFFLIKMLRGSAARLKKFLAEEYGILIRNASNFRGLDESFFRIAVQNKKKNSILISGIKEYMKNAEQK